MNAADFFSPRPSVTPISAFRSRLLATGRSVQVESFTAFTPITGGLPATGQAASVVPAAQRGRYYSAGLIVR